MKRNDVIDVYMNDLDNIEKEIVQGKTDKAFGELKFFEGYFMALNDTGNMSNSDFGKLMRKWEAVYRKL